MTRRSRKSAPECRPEEAAFLQSIVDNPHDEGLWLILADWLEENDDPRRAELLRLHRMLLATCCEPDRHPERATQQARIVQLLTEGVQPCVPRHTLVLAKDAEMTFAWIPPGRFLMGSPDREKERYDHETQHVVILKRGFWLALTPVTQAQWHAVMGGNPSQFKGKDLPVEGVCWDDCQRFCRQLGERAGKSLRLPTEAEWEYACRAGTTTPFFFGETLSTQQANIEVSVCKTTAAGCFPANAWGLFDMHGNLWEWCQDWYEEFGEEAVQDPAGPATGTARVLRGGSWDCVANICRAASRLAEAPAYRNDEVGLRPAFRLD